MLECSQRFDVTELVRGGAEMTEKAKFGRLWTWPKYHHYKHVGWGHLYFCSLYWTKMNRFIWKKNIDRNASFTWIHESISYRNQQKDYKPHLYNVRRIQLKSCRSATGPWIFFIIVCVTSHLNGRATATTNHAETVIYLFVNGRWDIVLSSHGASEISARPS